MAKGYSIRRTENYYRGKDGQWKGHSSSVHDENHYTRIFPTIESAREFIAADKVKENARRTPDDDMWTRYWTIYLGKEKIETIQNDGGAE